MSAGNEQEFIDHLQNKQKGGRSMKCPLRGLYIERTSIGEQPDQRPCLEEECAWWDEFSNCCFFRTQAKQITRLASIMGEIEDKMPHEEQFRK